MTLSVNAQTKYIKAESFSSTLTYTMKNPLHDWTGDSDEFNCSIEYDAANRKIKSVEAEAIIISFDSNIKMRNKNAFKMLDSNLFPVVKFVADDISLLDNTLIIVGLLTFHGVTHPIKFAATQVLVKNQLSVKGKFSIKLTDFKLQPPSLLGLKADDNIDIKFAMNFVVE
ncbi:MAG: YceI family protein [Spirosomaceae bacterium]|nr:YceI family protein [Spirosomataceae bacterium]